MSLATHSHYVGVRTVPARALFSPVISSVSKEVDGLIIFTHDIFLI